MRAGCHEEQVRFDVLGLFWGFFFLVGGRAGRGPHLVAAVLKGYSWLCTQRSPLTDSGDIWVFCGSNLNWRSTRHVSCPLSLWSTLDDLFLVSGAVAILFVHSLETKSCPLVIHPGMVGKSLIESPTMDTHAWLYSSEWELTKNWAVSLCFRHVS